MAFRLLQLARPVMRNASQRAKRFAATQNQRAGLSGTAVNNVIRSGALEQTYDLDDIANIPTNDSSTTSHDSTGMSIDENVPSYTTLAVHSPPADWLQRSVEPPLLAHPPPVRRGGADLGGASRLHHDLPSLLECCYDRSSQYFVGRQHEYVSHALLSHLGFDLTIRGGANDKGIDLIGTWKLQDRDLRVVVQCKRLNKPVETKYLREMEGVLGNEPEDTLALMVAGPEGFSNYARAHVNRTEYPVILCAIQDTDLPSTALEARQLLASSNLVERLQLFIMNARAQALSDVVCAAKYNTETGSRRHVLLQHGRRIGDSTPECGIPVPGNQHIPASSTTNPVADTRITSSRGSSGVVSSSRTQPSLGTSGQGTSRGTHTQSRLPDEHMYTTTTTSTTSTSSSSSSLSKSGRVVRRVRVRKKRTQSRSAKDVSIE